MFLYLLVLEEQLLIKYNVLYFTLTTLLSTEIMSS
jgi:hypothetical protein